MRLDLSRRTGGFEVINLVSKHIAYTRIVVCTSYGSAEREEMARRAGAYGFFHKPKPLSQVAQ
jgi:ActR/RegA family two-component response regulator